MNALQSARSVMHSYTAAWEAQHLDRILALCDDPFANLRSVELVVYRAEAPQLAMGSGLPWWKRDGAQPNTFDPLQPLNKAPSPGLLWRMVVDGSRLHAPALLLLRHETT